MVPPALGRTMEIYPLAYTQVDWRIFNQVCQDILGISPSKGVDKSYLDIADPAAYVGSLDCENNPLIALRSQGPALDHCMFSFAGSVDVEILLWLQAHTTIRVYRKPVTYNEHFVILTASLREWVRSLELMLSKNTDRNARQLGTYCLAYLQQTGFRELFSKYKKTELRDGTTVLE